MDIPKENVTGSGEQEGLEFAITVEDVDTLQENALQVDRKQEESVTAVENMDIMQRTAAKCNRIK